MRQKAEEGVRKMTRDQILFEIEDLERMVGLQESQMRDMEAADSRGDFQHGRLKHKQIYTYLSNCVADKRRRAANLRAEAERL